MEIEIISKTENNALNRKENSFLIRHLGAGSPNRIEVRDKLAAMETVDTNLIFIVAMKPRFGIPEISGVARIYDNATAAERIEKSHIKIRNMPKDKRDEAWKAVKAKKGK